MHSGMLAGWEKDLQLETSVNSGAFSGGEGIDYLEYF